MAMTDNVVAFPGKVRRRRGYFVATGDCLVIREDGTLGFAPKEAEPPIRLKDDDPTEAEIKEDLAAEQRLAQAALERD